jgi:signal transduction histidine kinase
VQASTTDDVLSALGSALVPAWADAMRIVVPAADRPLFYIVPPDASPGGEPLPAQLCDSSPPDTVWLSPSPSTAGGSEGWTAIDLRTGANEIPDSRVVVMRFDGTGDEAALVLERSSDRSAWTATELAGVNECVRLVEFALRSAQQHQRALEARAAADAAAHRWSTFGRLSRLLVRSAAFDDVATSIVNGVVPYLADWALLDLVSPTGKLKRIRRCHALPERDRLLSSITNFPFGTEAKSEAIERLGRKGWLIPRMSRDEVRRLSGPHEHAALEELALQSVAVVPLVVGSRLHGTLTLATDMSGQSYRAQDLAFFNSLAHQAALALNSARLYEDAKRARMEREEVLAIVSHDLKNPLNTLGFALTILDQEGIAEESKALQFGIMERALGQMNELVRDLLDTARIDAGRFSVSPAPQEIASLVHEALLHASPLAERANVHLDVGNLDGLPPVSADRRRIMQVFANLIDNAISFTPAQGRVRVSALVRETMVEFEIADSGPGLEPEVVDHIFDRFWQARHSGRAGAGLGLAIARGIVEAHGGEIGVRSEAGGGAVFRFSIPRAST